MKLFDLLNSSFIDLPKERSRYLSFQDYIKQTFAEYIKLISDLCEERISLTYRYNPQNSIIPNVTKIFEHLSYVIDHYLNGNIYQAYTTFHYLFTPSPKFSNNLNYTLSFCSYETPGIEKYYRIRVNEGEKFERKDLFHVPFEDRNKIASKRYSIPGLPSLYLSDSIYTAWLEMGKDDLRKYSFSRFIYNNLTPSLLVIPSTKRLKDKYESASLPDGLDDFFTLWPLFFLCSIIVLEPEKPFKPEYIIPQILLQWIKSEASWFDGIKYAATRDLASGGHNVVIPIDKSKQIGYCDKLSRLFELTSPITIDDFYAKTSHKFENEREILLKLEEYLHTLETNSIHT